MKQFKDDLFVSCLELVLAIPADMVVAKRDILADAIKVCRYRLMIRFQTPSLVSEQPEIGPELSPASRSLPERIGTMECGRIVLEQFDSGIRFGIAMLRRIPAKRRRGRLVFGLVMILL